MKKGIIITVAILLVFIVGVSSYLFIYGGKPEIENFDIMSKDYETIANASIKYYNALSYQPDHRTLLFDDDGMRELHLIEDDVILNLTEGEKSALKTVNKDFNDGYLWVAEDYVIFWQDETKYYGLVYSENPLSTIWDMKTDWYDGVEYHRINSNWYEIGAFGR